jgi:hypothetical protein
VSDLPCGNSPCWRCGGYHTTGWCGHLFPPSVGQTFPPNTAAAPSVGQSFTLKFPSDPPRLHPDDIEAIARRVVEMMHAETP